MATTIDSLDIQISAQASAANKAIGTLSQSLSTLSHNLGRLNGSSLSNFSSAMNTLSEGMRNLNGIKAKDFTPIANGIKKFADIDTGKISSIGGSLKTLADGLNTISGISFNAEGLNSISSALNKLGYVKATEGAENLLKIENSLSQFVRGMNDIGSVTFDTTNLSNLITSISRLGGTRANEATENLPRISAQLQNFVRQLNQIGSLSFDTTNLSNLITAISMLGQGSVKGAADNLPALTRELNNLMTTLSRAPKVSDNVIRMTEALANLASQGEQAGSAANSLRASLNSISGPMSGLTRITGVAITKLKYFSRQLLASMGIYAGIYGIVKGLKKSIESSMDYVEVLNYFDAAFTQIAEKADYSNFRELGYASAEEYARSFSERAKELTSQMTGFTATEKGTLEATGMPSLGLNPSELMNYQAMFAQMASSMGVASETSLDLSRALTEIGADLASVKNLDFEDVWKDMASGLAGMSRTLDKYGVNIRNVNLQQKLSELGVNANIQALNQNDKALLRTIILLDSTRYAWGDLSETISQPANQLRLIEANFQNLGRTIGNLFLPVIQKVLPYINGLVIAMQRLFAWVGSLLGIDLSKVTSSVGSTDFSGLIEDTDDLTGGLNGATKAAEKFKTVTHGIDELNINAPQEQTSGAGATGGGLPSGLLDAAFENALNEYQEQWDEAFANMENRAQELADKVEKALEPVKKIIQDFAVGDFFQAGKDVSNLVTSIVDFFTRAIKKVNWYKIGQNIGKFLAGIDWVKILRSIGKLIWTAIEAALDVWAGAFDAAPVETGIITAIGILKFTGLGSVLSGILLPKINGALDKISKGLNLKKFATGIAAVLGEFTLVSDAFEGLVSGSQGVGSALGEIVIGAGLAAGALKLIGLSNPSTAIIVGITSVIGAIKGINDAFDKIRAEEIGNTIKNAMTTPGGTPLSEITSNFAIKLSEAASGFDTIKNKSSEMDSVQKNIENTWLEIEKIQEAMENDVISVDEGKQELERLFGELAILTEEKFSKMNTAIMSAYGENGSFRAALESMGADTETAIDTMIKYGYQNSEKAKEIAEELAGMNIGDEGYAEKEAQLQSLTGEMSGFAKATSDFTYNMNSLQGKIDYNEIFLEDGSVDTNALQSYLDEATTALSDYEISLDEAGREISQYWEEILNSTTATEEQKAVAQSQLDYIPQAISAMKSDAELEIVSFTDMLQIDFISRTNQIIDDSIKEWEDKGWFGQWVNGILGAGTEGDYVKETVDQQQENIDELSETIETSLSDLGTEGAGWASDAAKEIYGKLFDSQYIFSEMGPGHYKYTLNKNYNEIIIEGTEGLSELAAQRGKEAVEGYISPFENTKPAEETVRSFVEAALAVIAVAQDSHSPSKVTEKYGKDAVDGYNLGIENNSGSTLDVISRYESKVLNKLSEIAAPIKQIGIDAIQGLSGGMSSAEAPLYGKAEEIVSGVSSKFSEVVSPIVQFGIDAMQGLSNGMSSMENSLYAKAGEIAGNVAKTVQSALEIHSPSRVMFRLGDYTMQGFWEGMENLYEPIIKSAKGFSRDLQIAPMPSIKSLRDNASREWTSYNFEGYSVADGIALEQSYRSGDADLLREQNALIAEQNALLRELADREIVARIDPTRETLSALRSAEKRYGYQFTS